MTLVVNAPPQAIREDGDRKTWLTVVGGILAAVITAAGAIAVAWISKDNSNKLKDSAVRQKQIVTPAGALRPKVYQPFIPENASQGPFGFTTPPEVRIEVEQSGGLITNPVVAYLSRKGQNSSQKPVRSNCITVEPQAANQVAVAILNTTAAIKDLFQKAPFGRYLTTFEAWGQSTGKTSAATVFNYVYIDGFTEPTFASNDNSDFSIAPTGGMLIQRQGSQGRYSSADLNQMFTIVKSCMLLGCYQVWPQERDSVIALEVGLIADGTRNPRFTVTLGDGPADTYSITAYPEARDPQPSRGSGRPIKMGGANNYFIIKWSKLQGDLCECKVFVGDSFEGVKRDIDADALNTTGQKAYAHGRTFEADSLAVDYFKVRIQGRGNGKILLKQFVVSELPYRENTFALR